MSEELQKVVMLNKSFVLGVHLGDNEDEGLREAIRTQIKDICPNASFDFDWYNPCVMDAYGIDFEIISIEGDSHNEAMMLKEALYNRELGYLFGDFH